MQGEKGDSSPEHIDLESVLTPEKMLFESRAKDPWGHQWSWIQILKEKEQVQRANPLVRCRTPGAAGGAGARRAKGEVDPWAVTST